jgi:vacuolar-type H+-ATPase subunit I/STV1
MAKQNDPARWFLACGLMLACQLGCLIWAIVEPKYTGFEKWVIISISLAAFHLVVTIDSHAPVVGGRPRGIALSVLFGVCMLITAPFAGAYYTWVSFEAKHSLLKNRSAARRRRSGPNYG